MSHHPAQYFQKRGLKKKFPLGAPFVNSGCDASKGSLEGKGNPRGEGAHTRAKPEIPDFSN